MLWHHRNQDPEKEKHIKGEREGERMTEGNYLFSGIHFLFI
jgi:hypothetical protein